MSDLCALSLFHLNRLNVIKDIGVILILRNMSLISW
jgi:hypothetical protein